MRVILDKALKVGHQLVDRVFHVAVPVVEPDLVLFRDGQVFGLGGGGVGVEEGGVGYAVGVLGRVRGEGEQVVGHGLVGEFVE